MRVLLIEDDSAIADGVRDALGGDEYEVVVHGTGAGGLAALDSTIDVVVLDLGLPDIDGADVCRALRERSDVPIIVISARSDEIDRVLILELGADDYLVKPFGLRELLARIRAVLRRSRGGSSPRARSIGPLTFDVGGRRVTLDGEPVHLTATEFDVLVYLADDPGVVRRRADILRDVWQTEWFGATKTLDAHVAAIRRKLGDPDWIVSVRGVGFRFEAPG